MEVKGMNNQTTNQKEATSTESGEKNKSGLSGKYIVLDIVFYGSSLNYDQGAGNYQELKKITKWDGKQYSLVSRYALRYSLLETAKNLGLWNLAEASHFKRAGEGGKTVIQPSINILLSGEILNYPEFDLFGYLITKTNPQNAREAPVKISHAVSLTPYTYDSQFCGNLGLAKRMIATTGKMDPNLFTVEEHQTYYIYTVVIDVGKIGKSEVYLAKDQELEVMNEDNKTTIKLKISEIEQEDKKLILKEISKNKKEEKIIPIDLKDNVSTNVNKSLEKVFQINYELSPTTAIMERVKQLIKAILYLNRNIKGRNEILHPKLLIVGLNAGTPYKSYKDRIILTDEYEEVFEEKKEKPEDNDNEIKVVRRIVKLKKPVFLLKGVSQQEVESIDKAEEKLVGNTNNEISNFLCYQANNQPSEKLYIFKAPEIEVRFAN